MNDWNAVMAPILTLAFFVVVAYGLRKLVPKFRRVYGKPTHRRPW